MRNVIMHYECTCETMISKIWIQLWSLKAGYDSLWHQSKVYWFEHLVKFYFTEM